ncbi:MAG: hypothetical protein J7605_04085 [Variovorax sp.]|nr:hypothetical protein [Variovorax sp.]
MRFVIKAAAWLVALNVVFLILTIAVQSLDAAKIEARLRMDVASGVLGPGNQVPGPFGHNLDMFTECIALSAGAVPPDGASAVRRALEHRYFPGAESGKADPCGALTSYLDDDRATVLIASYVRYWHGYDVYLLPMVRLGMPQKLLRYLNLVMVTVLCVGLLHASARLFPLPVMASLLVTLFLTADLFAVPLVTAHVVGLLVCFATAWAAAVYMKLKPDDSEGLRWIALFSGAVFAFVDFLVNPPLTPALLMFLVIAARRWNRPEMPARSVLVTSSSVGLTWFAGYLATWAGKWILSAIVLGPRPVFDEVFANIVKRTIGNPESETQRAVSLHFGAATLANIEVLSWTLLFVSLVAAAAILATAAVRGHLSSERVRDFLLVATPALVPVLWLEVLRNHSIVHVGFVFRDLGMSLGVVVAAAMFVLVAGSRAAGREGRRTSIRTRSPAWSLALLPTSASRRRAGLGRGP